MEIIEQEKQTERVILVSIDTGAFDIHSSLDELTELTDTAGGEVVGELVQKRESPDKATALGAGRLEELRQICEAQEVDLVIFDGELTATQHRNLEDALPCRVIDRTTLILDIFAGRARSAEGRLQVPASGDRAPVLHSKSQTQRGTAADGDRHPNRRRDGSGGCGQSDQRTVPGMARVFAKLF